MADTIFALSSGLPPAGIAVIRISGPQAGGALGHLAGRLPAPRRVSMRSLRHPVSGEELDQGLVLWIPGPASASGEDMAELHVHGGRAVVAAILEALSDHEGLREAQPGEFTRRAFENGRIDLSQAEGLAELVAAETDWQRRSALAMAEGGLGRRVEGWRAALLKASAIVEAELDFSDEGDVGEAGCAEAKAIVAKLCSNIDEMLATPSAERLHDGIKVVLAGPPNSGKSSLFNALLDREAAIVSETAGTTRDRIEAPVSIGGIPLIVIDTAGLRETQDPIESIGVKLAAETVAQSDFVLWLGAEDQQPPRSLLIAAKADLGSGRAGLSVSARTGEGLSALRSAIVEQARALLPAPGALALNRRHRSILGAVKTDLLNSANEDDPLILAEHLRAARTNFDRLTGRTATEDMLDALFGQLCIGK